MNTYVVTYSTLEGYSSHSIQAETLLKLIEYIHTWLPATDSRVLSIIKVAG